jgi:hypothetical protein
VRIIPNATIERIGNLFMRFGSAVPGCDEPADGAPDEGEISAVQEEMAELLYDMRH